MTGRGVDWIGLSSACSVATDDVAEVNRLFFFPRFLPVVQRGWDGWIFGFPIAVRDGERNFPFPDCGA